MTDVPEHLVQTFISACDDVAKQGLVRCSSGNLSLRVDEERMLVTTSRSWMERVTARDICICRIDDGRPLEDKRPSVETGFHAAILQARAEINVVLHFQTPCATALACRDEAVNYHVIPEIPFYIGPIAKIPFLLPGTPELAQRVTDAMRTHDMVTIANHGQVTVAADVTHAIQNAVFFELACEIIVHGHSTLKPLSETHLQELLTLRIGGQRTDDGKS